MAKNNKMPAIRFSGYTDTWEQRKLLDIAKTFIGLVTTMTENYRDSGTLLIRNSDIKEGQFVFSENPIHLDEEFAKKNKTRRLQIGDVVTVHTGDIGTSAVIEEKEAGAIGFATINTRTDKSILNPYFLATYFNTEKHKCYANSVSTGDGRSNYNIKDFNKLVISVPTLDEQERISVLINDMNTIITLHQRKLEKLKLTKKALLQKLFPQNGSKFPELRFKGFTAAWEQCKLSDITEIVMGQSPSSKNYTDNPNDNILVQGNADLKDGKVVPRLWTKEITKTIDKDGIVLTVRAPVGDVAKTDYKVVLGRGVAGIKGNDYIYQFLQKLQNNRYWVSLSSGSTFESINSNDIKDLIIDIPSIEEQTKISMLLNNVNSIITLHQRKLEMLKNVKKGLLQKMFV